MTQQLARRGGRPMVALATAMALAAVLAIGGIHLYADNQAKAAVAATPDSMRFTGLNLINRLDDPPQSMFAVVFELDNPARGSLHVDLHDVVVDLDGITYDAQLHADSTRTLAAGETAQFRGDIVLPGRVLDDLRTRGSLPLRITGQLEASTRYLWGSASGHASLWFEADAAFD